jgi:hypothetical protein
MLHAGVPREELSQEAPSGSLAAALVVSESGRRFSDIETSALFHVCDFNVDSKTCQAFFVI